jgi:predicted ATPase
VFVGRAREMEALVLALDALDTRRGSVFLVSGEPGIGKTRLADELGTLATSRGTAVAWGAAWDGGGAPAYWPWIQVLRAIRPILPRLDERLRADLGPLWDDGRPDDADPGGDPEVLRFRRFDALRAVLCSAATRAPLLVILDDLHAADRASLLALQFVARALRTLPILVVGTHRDFEARTDATVGDLLARIGREGTVLRLDRLGRDDVARLLEGLEPVTPRLVDDVFAMSGGNPLFVDETLRLVQTGARAGAVPEGVSAVIRDRLARFEAPARAALEAAAVLGREVAWTVLAGRDVGVPPAAPAPAAAPAPVRGAA